MFQWKVAHYTTSMSLGGKALTWWCKQIENRSGGSIKIKPYFSGELVKQAEMLKAVQSGVADAAYVGMVLYPERLRFSNVCYIPFLPPTRVDHQILSMNELVRTSPLVQEELDKCNAVYGYNYSGPSYNLIGNKPIRTVDDLQGVKVKCAPAAGTVFKKFGAIPILPDVLSILESYSALRNGTIDLVNFGGSISVYDWKLYKVSKYYIRGVDMGGSRSFLLINKNSWNALPDDIKGVIKDLRFEFACTLQSLQFDPQRIKEVSDAFKAEGIEIIEFPLRERAKLIAAAGSAKEEWVDKNGGEPARQVLNAYLSIKEDILAKYPNGAGE